MHASTDYSDLLLRLYRLAHEQPIDCFQDEALGIIKPVLPFDSAMWGSATMTAGGIDVHTLHLHRQPVEMLQAYEEVKHLDTAAQAVTRHPAQTMAFDARAWFSGKHQRALLDYGRRFEQSHFFIGGTFDPCTSFTRWLTLFRADPGAHGTENERSLLATLMPHVQQALEFNRLAHLNRLPRVPGGVTKGSALADPRGMIDHMDTAFEQALRMEWPAWRGPVLPDPVLAAAQRGEARLLAHTLVIALHARHGLLWLQARSRCAADSLSPRERAVARFIAEGHTHKQIAARFQRSPATVRNQIRSIYSKLEVSNAAELVEALRMAG